MTALFWILWVVAALATGALMAGAWSGPHRSVSNLSRWAARFGLQRMPDWLVRRSADRFAFRGGLVVLAMLVVAPWLMPHSTTAPPAPEQASIPVTPQPSESVAQPGRQLDDDFRNAIRVHVPKDKQVRLAVLSGDNEADRFAWQIDAFLRAEGYRLAPRLLYAMAAGGKTPVGTSLYPDENDPNILVIRIGLNDRK